MTGHRTEEDCGSVSYGGVEEGDVKDLTRDDSQGNREC